MGEQVAFPALIDSLSVKMEYGDKIGKIVLKFRPDDETIDGLNKLTGNETEVMVGIVPAIENNNHQRIAYNASTQRKKRQPQRPPEGNAQ